MKRKFQYVTNRSSRTLHHTSFYIKVIFLTIYTNNNFVTNIHRPVNAVSIRFCILWIWYKKINFSHTLIVRRPIMLAIRRLCNGQCVMQCSLRTVYYTLETHSTVWRWIMPASSRLSMICVTYGVLHTKYAFTWYGLCDAQFVTNCYLHTVLLFEKKPVNKFIYLCNVLHIMYRYSEFVGEPLANSIPYSLYVHRYLFLIATIKQIETKIRHNIYN